DRDVRAIEHERRLLTKERDTLHEADARMRSREESLRQREETFRKRLAEEVDAQVRLARKEIDDVVAQLKAKAAAIATAPRLVSTGDTGLARAEARAAVDEIAARAIAGQNSSTQSELLTQQSEISTVSVGDRVIVGGLGLEATIISLHDGTADLDVR